MAPKKSAYLEICNLAAGSTLSRKKRLTTKAANATAKGEKRPVVGTYRGFEISALKSTWGSEGFRFAVKGSGDQEYLPDNMFYGFDESMSLSGWFQRLDNFLESGFEKIFANQKYIAEQDMVELATVQSALGQDFPQKAELALTRENYDAIMRELLRMQQDDKYVSTWEPKKTAEQAPSCEVINFQSRMVS